MNTWKVGDILVVVDSADNQKRKCKIKAIDNDNKRIQIHYIKFNDRYDEWIDFTSDRITGDEVNGEDVLQLDDEVKAALGELTGIDEVTAKVIPCYCPDQNLASNEKKLNAFPVATIQMCAESMNIDKVG